MAAALDAVKEHTKLPWNDQASNESPSDSSSQSESDSSPDENTTDSPTSNRVLHSYHFEKALKEITPSASEQLGTLADLRKWNEDNPQGWKDRVLAKFNTLLENTEPILDVISDGSIPFGGLVKALSYLVKLGVVRF